MAVLASKRGISNMEFYNTAMALRKEIVKTLLRDFGYKSVNPDEYRSWFINFERQRIVQLSADLVLNVVYANYIYTNTDEAVDQRRSYQNLAIATVHALIEEFQHLMDVFPVGKMQDAMARFIEMCETELRLLKSWRKKTKRITFKNSKETKTTDEQNEKNTNQGTTIMNDGFLDDLDETGFDNI